MKHNLLIGSTASLLWKLMCNHCTVTKEGYGRQAPRNLTTNFDHSNFHQHMSVIFLLWNILSLFPGFIARFATWQQNYLQHMNQAWHLVG